MELTKELITWILVIVGTNLSAVILAIISWVKAAKMIPKDLKKSDLENRSKEVSIADQLDELATRAADKALKTQARLDKLETDYENMEEDNRLIKQKVNEQDEIIKEQANIISKQSARLDLQEQKIMEQEEEIALLRCELSNSQSYNQALIAQMKEVALIPVAFETIITENCEELIAEQKKLKNGRKRKKVQE